MVAYLVVPVVIRERAGLATWTTAYMKLMEGLGGRSAMLNAVAAFVIDRGLIHA